MVPHSHVKQFTSNKKLIKKKPLFTDPQSWGAFREVSDLVIDLLLLPLTFSSGFLPNFLPVF